VYKSTERYIAYVNNLAANGYIVYRIDYRGHDRSDGEPTGAYGSTGYTVDVLNAVSSLKAFPQADPDRIGMWGHSLGGFLTLRAMVISPDIKAAVIWAGVVASYPDLLCCWRTPTPGPTATSGPTATLNPDFRPGWRSWQREYGSPEENLKFWLGVSANSYLADLSGPLQLHHGTADTDVPIKFSRDLFQQLLDAGQVAEYYEYEGDDHNLAGSFSLAMTRTLNFFDQYLKGAP
jgi:dipeptidyl aminopeptidase/acylaminoacyl peptidase